jgi:hypothetical protein
VQRIEKQTPPHGTAMHRTVSTRTAWQVKAKRPAHQGELSGGFFHQAQRIAAHGNARQRTARHRSDENRGEGQRSAVKGIKKQSGQYLTGYCPVGFSI